MAHGVTPEALEGALARVAGGVSSRVHRLADLLRDGGRRRGLRRGRARRRRGAGRRLRLGLALRLSPGAARSPLQLGADAMLASTHKIVGSLTQSAMLHVATRRPDRPDARRARVRLVRSTSPSSLLLASLDAARRQLAVHGEALLDRTIAAAAAGARGDRRDPGVRGRRRAAGRAPRDRRLGPAADRDRRPRHRLHRLRARGARCARSYDIYIELATHATLVLVLGLGQPVEPLERFAHDFAETVRRIARPGEPARSRPRPVAVEHETAVDAPRRVPRRRRGGARRGGDRADLVRVDRRLSARRADAAARRARDRGGRRVPAGADGRRRAAARRRRPELHDGPRARLSGSWRTHRNHTVTCRPPLDGAVALRLAWWASTIALTIESPSPWCPSRPPVRSAPSRRKGSNSRRDLLGRNHRAGVARR